MGFRLLGVTCLFFCMSCGSLHNPLYRPADDFEDEAFYLGPNNRNHPFYGIHAKDGVVNPPLVMHLDAAWDDDQSSSIRAAVEVWNDAIGQQILTIAAEPIPYPEIPDLYGHLDDDINGIWKADDWSRTNKSEIVLGTSIWENSDDTYSQITLTDILINTDNYYMGDAWNPESNAKGHALGVLCGSPHPDDPIDNAMGDSMDDSMDDQQNRGTSLHSDTGTIDPDWPYWNCQDFVDLESLMIHELGHTLGLAHVSVDVDKYSIMNPSLYIGEGMANRMLSEGDISRVRKIYHKPVEE